MKNLWVKGALPIFSVAMFMILPEKAMPLTMTFYKITNNSPFNVANQLTVNVTNPGSGKVQFDFFNVGSISSSITDIYFDDNEAVGGNLASFNTIENGSGVSFASPATPSNLPGGSLATPPFVTTTGLSADSDSPIIANGINTGENLGIVFNLVGGRTFNNILTDLQTGNLRIGLHVQAIGGIGGTSDSYVSGIAPTPEPGTLILLGTGLFATGGIARLRRKK